MNKQSVPYADLELEVIALGIIVDIIDAMINRVTLDVLGEEEATVFFSTSVHQKYFYILLADFLSSNTDVALVGERLSCVELLDRLCHKPLFDANDSIALLKDATTAFKSWLGGYVGRNIWLPGMDREVSLSFSREDIIFIAGTISKHHSGHLVAVIKKLNEALGGDASGHGTILALEEIYADLHDNVLNYHGSAVVEMLNNIRWGIHEYLRPEFDRAYRKLDDERYKYIIPDDIKAEFAKARYWALMNTVRAKPYIDRFKADKMLRLRY